MNDTRSPNTNSVLAAIVVIGSLLLMVVIALGIGIVRAISARPTPPVIVSTPIPDVRIADPFLRSGATFALSGSGWSAGRRVYVYLSDPAQPADRVPVFSTEADAQGGFIVSVQYPAEPRWAGLAAVDVIVQSQDDPRLEVIRRLPVERAAPTASATPTPIPATGVPTPTPTPTATPTQVFADWKGEYFDNPSLAGAPVVTRNDVEIRFSWGGGSPAGGLPADNFSARWTRSLTLQGGVHRFRVSADDGVRVYVDDVALIDEWRTATGQGYAREVNLAAGAHTLRVEFLEQGGLAGIEFAYEAVISYADWKGDYFANRDLIGAPVFTRNDRLINFEWGNGPPDPRLPADGFSVRWTRTLAFPGGFTRFVVRADDGVRLSIDNQRVLDEWHDSSAATYTRDINLPAGSHLLVLEYYESSANATVTLSLQPASFLGWKAEYFANRTLSGVPALVRDEADLNFDWLGNAPAPELPADDFSARWTRTLYFDAGSYRFALSADDGARVFVDEVKLIDEWRDGSNTYDFTLGLSSGPHTLRVEYYEHLLNARLGLSWVRLIDTPTASPTPTPTTTFTPAPVTPASSSLGDLVLK